MTSSSLPVRSLWSLGYWFACLLSLGGATAQDMPSPSPPAEVIMDEQRLRTARQPGDHVFDRTAHDRIVHIFGDSIGRGLGFIEFEDPSPLSRIQDIAQMLLAEQGVPAARLFVRYAWTQDPAQITAEIARSMILPGDIILFEDAGPHENNVALRRRRLRGICAAARLAPAATLVLTTTFDHNPSAGFVNSEYDKPVDASGMTMNQLLREVAAAEGVPVLDWDRQLAVVVEGMKAHQISVIHEDGVHPNALGNFALAVSLLDYLGFEIKSCQTVVDKFMELDKAHVDNLHLRPPLELAAMKQILEEIARLVVQSHSIAPKPASDE